MPNSPDESEYPQESTTKIEPPITYLSQKYTESYPGELKEITVSAQNIALPSWHEMLTLTESDNAERGLIVFQDTKNNFHQGKIFKGEATSITTTDIPIGIKDVLRRYKRAVIVHTHNMKDLEHLSTTLPSDHDIHSFAYFKNSAFIILDAKGVHMLTHIKLFNNVVPPQHLVEEMLKKEKEGEGIAANIQRNLARELPKYGISYFYRQGVPAKDDETVTFNKLPD